MCILQRADRSRFRAAALIWLLLLVGCAAPVDLANQPLQPQQSNVVADSLDWSPDRPLILMTFSGGGSRAAALALFTLQELQKHGDGEPGRHLIDDVAVISSVSGGSVTAAYFGLYGKSGLARLEPDFLARDNMAELELQAVNPVTLSRLIFGSYTRVDALRDLLDRQLFHHQTFAAVMPPGHPVIILNATDMASGEVFAFTPQRFNEICSNLSGLPLSVGVAASAAFPILLSPVNLQDFWYPHCPGNPSDEQWITDDLQHHATRYLDLDQYEAARYANALRHGRDAYRDIRYLHLLDGGVADNLGIHSLMDVIGSPHATVPILRAINEGKLRRLVVITVRARSTTPSPLNQQASTPGVVAMVNAVANDPINNATTSIAAQKKAFLDQLRAAVASAPPTADFRGLGIYDVDVDFDQLLPEQTRLRNTVEAIPTSWTITQTDLANIRLAATLLVNQHPCFQRLLMDLGQAPATDSAKVAQLCPQPLASPASNSTAQLSAR